MDGFSGQQLVGGVSHLIQVRDEFSVLAELPPGENDDGLTI